MKDCCVRLDELTIDPTLPILIDLSRRSHRVVGSNPTICLINFEERGYGGEIENRITIRSSVAARSEHCDCGAYDL
jgi:hypothetical protein